jgi:hypothetical protein
MKTLPLTMAAGLLAFLASATLSEAQQWDPSQPVAFAYSGATEPTAAAPVAPQPATPAAQQAPTPEAPAEASAEEEEECKSRWCHCGEMGDPWTLPQPCLFQQMDIKISGWTEAGMLTNNHGAPSNGPLGLNNLTDFNLHQLWFTAEKKTNTEDNCWDLGGRVDYVYGVDGPDTQSFGDQGWDYGWNSSSRYGSAIPQMYLELAFGDWSIKGGHFYTAIGYEVVPATGNFFYSHAYAFYYSEPFTHTGFQVTRKLNDKISVFGGWVDGWDSGWENLNDSDTFLGGVNLTLSEKASLVWAVNTGNWGSGQFGNSGDIYMNSFVFSYKLSDNLTYVLQHDLGKNTNLADGDKLWYGFNQYLLYKMNDCWSAGARFEWFKDQDGARVVPGNSGDYCEITLGLNYKPHANLLLRPEIRWDWYDGEVAAVDAHPFNRGQSDSQFTGGFDLIFTF